MTMALTTVTYRTFHLSTKKVPSIPKPTGESLKQTTHWELNKISTSTEELK